MDHNFAIFSSKHIWQTFFLCAYGCLIARVAAFPDLRNSFYEYNVIVPASNQWQNYENQTQVFHKPELSFKHVHTFRVYRI